MDDEKFAKLMTKLGQTWPAKLAQSVFEAVKLPGDVYQGRVAMYGDDGRINPEVIHKSADLAGVVMGGGMPMAERGAVGSAGGKLGVRAYHGSPHDFDKFDLSKIGTGEGAQAYGHGLYFAENEGVARGYREALSRHPGYGPGAGQLARDALKMARDTGLDGDEARRFAREYLTNQAPKVNALSPQHYYDAVNNFDALTTGKGMPGRMYEVNINADPARFLDWDKPLSRQTAQDAVRQAMGDRKWDEFKFADAGTAVRNGFFASDDALTSSRLREAGIPGIKYLDQGSRSAGQGSSNYVVFDDKLIDILRKYGIAGLPAAGVAGAAMQEPQEQP